VAAGRHSESSFTTCSSPSGRSHLFFPAASSPPIVPGGRDSSSSFGKVVFGAAAAVLRESVAKFLTLLFSVRVRDSHHLPDPRGRYAPTGQQRGACLRSVMHLTFFFFLIPFFLLIAIAWTRDAARLLLALLQRA